MLIEVPGLQDTSKLKDLLGATAKLEFRLVADAGEAPGDFEMLPRAAGRHAPGGEAGDGGGRGSRRRAAGLRFRAPASPTSTSASTCAAASASARSRRENVGRPFAIVLDGKVISAPRILGPITGGSGQITGNFTVEQADNLAVLLRAGALPAKLTVVEERTVGPGPRTGFDRRRQARRDGRRRCWSSSTC